jgi:hypothetical protein
MDWSAHLLPGETLRWEGRPAPRCFVLRNWRHSLFGLLLLLLAAWWQVVGWQLAPVYELPLLAWVPLPFLLIGLHLAFGHLLLARREWPHVFYAVTERRVLALRGGRRPRLQGLPLAAVTWFELRPHGEELATLRLAAGTTTLLLPCVQHPRPLAALLEAAMRESGALAGGESV